MEKLKTVRQDNLDTEFSEPENGAYETVEQAVVDDAEPDPDVAQLLEILKHDWGNEFDANLSYARDAVDWFADTELIALLEETGLGDDPRVVRAAARIGQQLATEKPGGPTDRSTVASVSGKAALNAELDRLIASPEYWTSRGQRRARDIFVRLNGNGDLPIHRHPGDAGNALAPS